MKKEENKKQEEQLLEEENLDNVAGGKIPGCGPITKKFRDFLK